MVIVDDVRAPEPFTEEQSRSMVVKLVIQPGRSTELTGTLSILHAALHSDIVTKFPADNTALRDLEKLGYIKVKGWDGHVEVDLLHV